MEVVLPDDEDSMKRKSGSSRGYTLIMAAAFVFLAAAVLFALCAGRYSLSATDVLQYLFLGKQEDRMTATVMWSVRIPRVMMALLVGAGLTSSGVSLQAMFGNPLVSSHILGVSYSAGFGAALGILLFSNFAYVEILALIFGFIGMGPTYFLSQKRGNSGTLMLVLSGVIVGAVFEALTSFIKYIADPEEKLPAITYWLMGSLSGSSMEDVYRALPIIGGAMVVLWLLRWRLNVLSLSEDEAASMGINIKRTRLVVIVATTVITAATVSMCGVISFVGLAVPHLTRMIAGNRAFGTGEELQEAQGGVLVLGDQIMCNSIKHAIRTQTGQNVQVGLPFDPHPASLGKGDVRLKDEAQIERWLNESKAIQVVGDPLYEILLCDQQKKLLPLPHYAVSSKTNRLFDVQCTKERVRQIVKQIQLIS